MSQPEVKRCAFSEEMRARAEAYAPDNANRVHRTRYSAFHAGAHAALESELVRGMRDALERVCKRNDISKAVMDYYGDCAMALKAYDEALGEK